METDSGFLDRGPCPSGVGWFQGEFGRKSDWGLKERLLGTEREALENSLPLRRLPLIAALLSLCWATTLFGQGEGRVPTRNLGVDQGLTNLSVYALVQDEEHTIWAGTESGIFRFNGQRFRAINLPLPSRFVQALLPDPEGGLWIATRAGLLRWDKETPDKSFPAQGVAETSVSHLARDRHQRIWALTLQGLRVSTDRTNFLPAPDWPAGEQGVALFTWPDSNKVLVVTARRLWVHEYGQAPAWKTCELPLTHPRESLVAVAEDGSGALWVRSDRALYRRLRPMDSWTRVNSIILGSAVDAPTLCRDREGWIWINASEGMVRAKGETIRLEEWSTESGSNTVALTDHEGSWWFGWTGVRQVVGRGLWRNFGKGEGLPNPTVWNVARDRKGRLWAATDGGLAIADAKGWKLVRRGQFCRLRLAPDGFMLAVGAPGGTLYRIDPDRLTLEEIHVEGIPNSPVTRGLALDGQGGVWIADRHRDHVARGVRRNGTWHWERVQINGWNPENIWQIQEAPRGGVALTARKGLFLWQEGEWTQVPGTLNLSPFQAIFDSGGELLVSYFDRPVLTHHRLVKDQWERVKTLEPFRDQPDLVIYSGILDSRRRLWLGTSQGLARLTPPWSDHPKWYARGEGIPGSDATSQGLFLDANEDLWFCTTEGLGRFRIRDDRSEEPPLLAPRLVSITPSVSQNPQGPLLLKARSTLEAHFGLDNFLHPTTTWLTGRLVGLDSDWVPLTDLHARYPALSPGKYSLEVRVSAAGGSVGPPLILPVQVLPEWWESAWARLLLGVVALGGLWAFFRLRQRVLRARNLELEAQVKERTTALETLNEQLAAAKALAEEASHAKSAFLASMSHELRTPLNAILLYAELVQDEARERNDATAIQDLGRISTAGKHLLSMINNILDLSKIEAGKMTLDMERVAIRPLLDEVVSTLRPIAAQKGNQLMISCPSRLPLVNTDLTKLRQVLINLLSNACKFTQDGRITVGASALPDELVLEVEDTGIGMTEAELDRIFGAFEQASDEVARRFGGTGLGLAISKRIVNLLGGTLQARSAPGRGSIFVVRLPL